MALFVLLGELVNLHRQVTVCSDPEDNMVIEAELAGDVWWVVTGDEDLLSLNRMRPLTLCPGATW